MAPQKPANSAISSTTQLSTETLLDSTFAQLQISDINLPDYAECFSQDSDTFERFAHPELFDALESPENALEATFTDNIHLKPPSLVVDAPDASKEFRNTPEALGRSRERKRKIKAGEAEGFWDTDEIEYEESTAKAEEEDDQSLDGAVYEHACRYCGIHSTDCVVKCNVADCQKWFCNSISGTTGSHIVHHLVRAKHKEVVLHAESPLGETMLECYNCGSRNVFILGFIHASQEGVVVLICREPCLSTMKDSAWDLSQWQPLIEDRAFLSWLVRSPNVTERKKAKPITSQLALLLENRWKEDPNATVEDVKHQRVDKEAVPVQLTYSDAYQYHNIFAPLVSAEAKYNKKATEGRKQEDLTVRWDIGLNLRRNAYFMFRKDEAELRLMVTDELKLSHPKINGKPWECTGFIARMPDNEEIALELKLPPKAPGPWDKAITTGFTVELVWKSTPYLRCLNALRSFVTDDTSLSGYLFHKLLGHSIEDQFIKTPLPRHFSAPHLAQLNHSQVVAVERALRSPLCLIQGPPGTGKTLASATIVYHLSKLGSGQILVVAPSNVAVDQLAEKIHQTGLKVVRMCAKSRELLPSAVDFLSLHNQLTKIRTTMGDEYRKLIKLKEEVGELSVEDGRRLYSIMFSLEFELLQCADVICTTCVGAGDPRLKGFRFRQVLIDEATQAMEPECLIPIVLGAKQIILVGDHRQLPPVILCKEAAKRGLVQSLFERLILLGIRPVRLEVQYRMHPCLSEFPSAAFYEGSLQNGVTLAERTYTVLEFPWPRKERPMFFYNSVGQEEVSASGTSYLNRTEASNIEKLITYLLKGGLRASQIGIITPYDGQRSYILSLFQRQTTLNQTVYQDIEVASVDAFQGREKDFILLSCVRSNQNLGIGFLSDPRRLNVALTRSKFGLIICGNAKVLAASVVRYQPTIWCNLLNHFKRFQLVVEGPLSNLKTSNIVFAVPTRLPAQPYISPSADNAFLSPDELQEYDRRIYEMGNTSSVTTVKEGYTPASTAYFTSPSLLPSSTTAYGKSIEKDGKLLPPSLPPVQPPPSSATRGKSINVKNPKSGQSGRSKGRRPQVDVEELLDQTFLSPEMVESSKKSLAFPST